jgi:DNA-binding NtrC family response regulator
MEKILKDKRILIVDDEPDILETLKELLDMCIIDTAPNFETARKFLKRNAYDAAILDIMGVKGYDLLELSSEKGIPALMLTAHALSADNLVKSIKGGAHAYLPKDKMVDIGTYLAEIIQAHKKKGGPVKKMAGSAEARFRPKIRPGLESGAQGILGGIRSGAAGYPR